MDFSASLTKPSGHLELKGNIILSLPLCPSSFVLTKCILRKTVGSRSDYLELSDTLSF